MAEILFNGINSTLKNKLITVFSLLQSGKNTFRLDEEKIKKELGQVYKAEFWHPTPEELKQWENDWFSTPVDERLADPKLKRPWDFGSWLDAISNADVDLKGITTQRLLPSIALRTTAGRSLCVWRPLLRVGVSGPW